jgi:hypothetical protein
MSECELEAAKVALVKVQDFAFEHGLPAIHNRAVNYLTRSCVVREKKNEVGPFVLEVNNFVQRYNFAQEATTMLGKQPRIY